MRRPTAFLVVLLLTALPGVSLACELWCNTPAASAHRDAVGCHRADAVDGATTQVGAAAECHDAPALTAFLIEPRQPEPRPTATAPVMASAALAIDRSLRERSRPAAEVRPARPPAFRTILRI